MRCCAGSRSSCYHCPPGDLQEIAPGRIEPGVHYIYSIYEYGDMSTQNIRSLARRTEGTLDIFYFRVKGLDLYNIMPDNVTSGNYRRKHAKNPHDACEATGIPDGKRVGHFHTKKATISHIYPDRETSCSSLGSLPRGRLPIRTLKDYVVLISSSSQHGDVEERLQKFARDGIVDEALRGYVDAGRSQL